MVTLGRLASWTTGALLFVAASASAELFEGDLIVADPDTGLIRVDPATGSQSLIPDIHTILSRPRGLAFGRDPIGREGRWLWIANSDLSTNLPLVAMNPETSGFHLNCHTGPPGDEGADTLKNDVEVTRNGFTLYSVGPLLQRHAIDALRGIEGPVVYCHGPETLADLEAELGHAGEALALHEDEEGVVTIWIALAEGGLAYYDVAAGELTAVAGTPTEAMGAVYGVTLIGGAVAFTQLVWGEPFCNPTFGAVLAGLFGIGEISRGGLLRCPRGITESKGNLFVTDLPVLPVGGEEARVVRLHSEGFSWVQSEVTSGDLLFAPADVEVVPEPGGWLLWMAALAPLALRRSGDWASASVGPKPS